jgi:hypothetical protein
MGTSIAKGDRFPGIVLHQRLANIEAQLVMNAAALKLRHRVA